MEQPEDEHQADAGRKCRGPPEIGNLERRRGDGDLAHRVAERRIGDQAEEGEARRQSQRVGQRLDAG